jgi:hypothetical protein
MVELGWKSVGLLELTALLSIDEERCVPLAHRAHVLRVSGATPSTLPHLDHEHLPENTLVNARTSSGLDGPAYANGDETALRVVGDTADVVSEAKWHRFDP